MVLASLEGLMIPENLTLRFRQPFLFVNLHALPFFHLSSGQYR